MTMAGVDEIGRALVADGKGILAADETVPDDHQAPGGARHRIDAGQPSRLPRDVLHARPASPRSSAASSCRTRRSGRRARRGEPLVDAAAAPAGIIPGIKVDEGAKPLAGAPGELVTEGLDGLRDRLRGVPRAGRALRQVARGDHHRRRRCPRDVLRRRQRARARALRRALPGAGPGADRRAGGADGRRPHHRALRGGDRAACCTRCSTRSSSSGWRSKGCC